MKKGKVIKSTGSWYQIVGEDGMQYKGRLRGKFRSLNLKVTNPIAVGENVFFETDQEELNTVIITELVPRKNEILRRSSRKSAFGHTLAANIDQLVILFTLKKPRTSLGFLDRLLVLSEYNQIPVLICLHKTDLLNEDDLQYLHALANHYTELGYRAIQTSIEDENTLDELKNQLDQKTSLFAGHSGTGKSTLINRFNPKLNIRTDNISKHTNKGQHTTTHAEIFTLWQNTYGIDSPGIKEMGFYDLESNQLRFCFPEFIPFQEKCSFHNCLHDNEPKCEVKNAVNEGIIALERYESYLSMLEELREYKEK